MLPALTAATNPNAPAFNPNNMQAPLQILATAAIALIIAAVITGQHFAQRPQHLPRTSSWLIRQFDGAVLYAVTISVPTIIFIISSMISASYALNIESMIEVPPKVGLGFYGLAIVILTGSAILIAAEHRDIGERAGAPVCRITCPECTLPCPCNRPCPCETRGRHEDGCHQPIPGADHQGPDCTQKCLCGAACPCGEPCDYCTRNTSPWRGLKRFRRNRPAPAASPRARGR